MPVPVTTIKIGGEAGQGIKSAGLLLAKYATRLGYHIYNHIEYPSLIRGGHNVMQINLSTETVTGPYLKCDFLIALNQDTIDRHYAELVDGGGVLFDSDKQYDLSKLSKGVTLLPVPLSKLAREAGCKNIVSNIAALGAVINIFGGDISPFLDLIQQEFEQKGTEVVHMNQAVAQVGYEFAGKNYAENTKPIFAVLDAARNTAQQTVINGNEAAALGAISAGLEFAAIYPMSPVSPILEILAASQQKHGFICKQPEDEIAAINMTIGAAFGGARAFTTTSGGGFCLMTESYGLAGMTETPLVIVEGMRGGPATGLPTWSGQGDLQMILHAHQGAFPKIILAPGDAKETFDLVRQAFNLADIYQTPVVVLIDKNICDNDQSFKPFDTASYQIDRGKLIKNVDPQYRRYKLEADGISPRAIAGSGNFFIANSDEHDETGYSTDESNMRKLQMEKRMSKLKTCAQNHMQGPQLIGPQEADLTIVSWGSNKGPVIESLKRAPNVNYLHLTWISPFPTEAVSAALQKAKRLLNVEANYEAQMAALIKEKTGITLANSLLKYDGRPFFAEEISRAIEGRLA
ncbi:MAG: 2-oxoacid:acceptor oxidoreductase subunit alpha [bacterium]